MVFIFTWMFVRRNRKAERRTLPLAGAHRDGPAKALDNLSADREAEPDALVAAPRMQPFERLKNSLEVTRVDADAVVGDGKPPKAALARHVDLDARAHTLRGIFERVADE